MHLGQPLKKDLWSGKTQKNFQRVRTTSTTIISIPFFLLSLERKNIINNIYINQSSPSSPTHSKDLIIVLSCKNMPLPCLSPEMQNWILCFKLLLVNNIQIFGKIYQIMLSSRPSMSTTNLTHKPGKTCNIFNFASLNNNLFG